MRIDETSLSRTIDAISAAPRPAAPERKAVARWIAARQGLPGAYGDTFAGCPGDAAGIHVFTGERMTSASARHILGEEACRALRVLEVRDAEVAAALARAEEGLFRCLARAALDPRHANPGRFCCGKCTVALWRNLLAAERDDDLVVAGLTADAREAVREHAAPQIGRELALDVPGEAAAVRIGVPQLGEHGLRVARDQFVQHRPLGGAPLVAAQRLSGGAGRAFVEATREHARVR